MGKMGRSWCEFLFIEQKFKYTIFKFKLQEMIQNGEIPAYKIFTHEPAKKRLRRLAKENREAKEAEEMKEELGVGSGNIFIY